MMHWFSATSTTNFFKRLFYELVCFGHYLLGPTMPGMAFNMKYGAGTGVVRMAHVTLP